MFINTTNLDSIKPYLKQLYIPKSNTHKGQNGKVLIIGGSSLFHSASFWAAEVASHIADIVHYSSTKENNQIFREIKKRFHNGIVVSKEDLATYVEEDEAILIGPGMVRVKDEGVFTHSLTKFLLSKFPDKRWVIDAGALQMIEKKWLKLLKVKPIITPHQKEFYTLFGIDVSSMNKNDKIKEVRKQASENNCVILLKSVFDIVSDGKTTVVIEGGNAGLTKGGTGDILAGLTVAFFAKNNPLISAIISSYLLKKTSDILFKTKGYWYNIDDIIDEIPKVLHVLRNNL